MTDIWEKNSISKDLNQCNLIISALQETKTKGTLLETIKQKKGTFFDLIQANSDENKHNCTVFIIESTLSSEFSKLSD